MTVTLTPEQWVAAMKALEQTQKHDPASLTLTAPALHGQFQGNAAQYGIFSDPTARPARWSTLARPPQGVYGLSRLVRSEFVSERLELMSGVTRASGTNATGWCGNPPTVGQGKVCSQDYEWGKLYLKTDLNALPEVGQIRRGEVPAEILNASPENRNPLIPSLLYSLTDTRSALAYELWRLGVHLERLLDTVGIQGDNTLASTDTELGFITEPDGLDLQIKTGHTDARTGLLCAAADSAIVSFNADVSGTIGGGDGRNIVQAVSDLVWGLKERAAAFGMPETTFAIVVRRENWRALVDVWACNYATYRCSTTISGVSLNNDLNTINNFRLEMMRGQYLLVDGEAVPVVFSEGIVRDGLGANQFKSDLYVVPVEWRGISLLNTEYFPMDNTYIQEFVNFVDADGINTMNNGLFMVGSRSTPFCKEIHFAAKFRLILETPWLAGRVDDIAYTFRAPIRNADPADTVFYANGGATFTGVLP